MVLTTISGFPVVRLASMMFGRFLNSTWQVYIGAIALVAASSQLTMAQELEPRTYANTPIGVNFIAVGVARSQGNVLLDPSLPIEDLDGKLNLILLRYTRSFSMLARSAKVKIMLPFSTGDWQGTLDGLPAERDAQGAGDVRMDLEWNFYGAPALDSEAFSGYEQKTIVGASMRITAPTGVYDADKLLNLGSNRWTARTELGVSQVIGKWALEFIGSIWFFSDNDDFLNGMTLEQRPLFVAKSHVIYAFRPGFWLGAGLGYGKGGRTEVDGVTRNTTQKNWRFGMTLAYPLNRKNGIALTLGSGANSGAGADYDTVALSYQYAWGGL